MSYFILTLVRECSTLPWACFCDHKHLLFQDRISVSRHHHYVLAMLSFISDTISITVFPLHEKLKGMNTTISPVKYNAMSINHNKSKADPSQHQ